MPAETDPRFLQAAVHRGLISTKVAEDVAARATGDVTAAELLVKEGYLTDRLVRTIADQLDHGDEPTQIAGFKILAKLGQGGMGTVYKALQVSMQREVALKVIAPRFAIDKDFCERFIREARTAGLVNHPNVITCYDVGKDQGYLYMALELVTGGDAAEIVQKNGGRMPGSQALEIISDCASGLIALKRAGLIHRDIKPANIFITKDGIAKLADLGLARSCTGDDRMTVTGAPMGTPAFMSPEQASGDGVIDIRTDIYALGATLFALLTGEPPYKGTSAWAVVAQVLKDPIPDPRHIFRGVSDGAASITMKAMAKERTDRYSSPEALIEDLDLVAAGRSPRHSKLLPPISDTWAKTHAPSHQADRAAQATSVGLEQSAKPAPEQRAPAPAKTEQPRFWPWLAAAAAVVAVTVAMQPKTVSAKTPEKSATTEVKKQEPAEIPLTQVAQKPITAAPPAKKIEPGPALANPLAAQLNEVHRVDPADLPKVMAVSEAKNDPVKAIEPAVEEVSEITEEPQDEDVADKTPTKPLVLPDPALFKAPEPEDKKPAGVVPAKYVAKPAPKPIPATPVAAKPAPAQTGSAGSSAVADTWQRFLSVKGFRASVDPLPSGNVAVLRLDPQVRDLSLLQALPIETLDLENCERLDGNLAVLAGKPLRVLKLRGCRRLKSLFGVEGAPLQEFTVSGCSELTGNLSALSNAKLRSLSLNGCENLTALDGIQGAQLTELDLTGCGKLTSIAPLRGLPLRRLLLTGCENLLSLDGLQGMPLAELSLSGCESLPGNLALLRGMKLTKLTLNGCARLDSLDGIQGMQLIDLNMSDCSRVGGDLNVLRGMPLMSLNASRCYNLISLNGLQGTPLKTITLTRCGKISDYTPLAGIKGVEIIR